MSIVEIRSDGRCYYFSWNSNISSSASLSYYMDDCCGDQPYYSTLIFPRITPLINIVVTRPRAHKSKRLEVRCRYRTYTALTTINSYFCAQLKRDNELSWFMRWMEGIILKIIYWIKTHEHFQLNLASQYVHWVSIIWAFIVIKIYE